MEEAEEAPEDLVEQHLQQEIDSKGLAEDLNDLICADYTEAQIQQDDMTNIEIYDRAIAEVQEAEKHKQQSIIEEQKRAYDQKMKDLEKQYKLQFD